METSRDGSRKIKASQHEDYWKFTLISIILPVIGLILGIVYLTKDNRLDKKLGEHTLAISVLFIIVWGSGFAILNSTLLGNKNDTSTSNAAVSQAISQASQDVQTANEDTTRQVDINALDSHLEAYNADNGYYPTLADINNSSWRTANLVGFDDSALIDPNGTSKIVVSAPNAGVYAYQVSPTSCDNKAHGKCTTFTLTAVLSTGQQYQKKSL